MLAGDVHVLVVQRHETDAKVLILLYMCPHTTIYVSSYYYICVLIRLYMCPHSARPSRATA